MRLRSPWTFAALALLAAPACRHAQIAASPQEIAWEAHHAEEEAGRLDGAIAGYREMCEAGKPYPRACYDEARALFDAGRTAEARAAAQEFIAGHPSNALAPVAAKRLSRSYAEEGEAAVGVAALGELARRTAGKDVWDSIQYEIARLHRSLGDREGERAALERVVDRGRWSSQLWDDSLWRLVELAAALGDRGRERRYLERLVASRERSRLVGSYASGYHDDALLRLGRLSLEEGRLDEAYRWFMELARWKTSRMRDDGYYWAAQVRLRQGRAEDACGLLRSLIEKIPGSGSEDEAVELMREAGCRAPEGGGGVTQ